LTNPTITEAVKLTAAHDYFNKTLFNGELNPCRISIASNGNSKWRGQFSPKKVTAGEESFDQILIDTDYTAECVEEKNLKLLFSTLVHEMCHQALPSSGHNEDWRDMMFSLGLEPVQVTKGRWSNATHQIIDGGLFDRACSNIPEDIINDWLSFRVQTEKKTKPFSKVVTCPVCGGKTVIKSRTFRVKCFDHDVEMV
jgi:predicted SprT family Zn-dependent metalloprotease